MHNVAVEIITGLIASPLLLIGALIAMVLIGIILIVVTGALIMLIPAFIVSGIVNWLTGSELLAGVSFLFIVVIAFARK